MRRTQYIWLSIVIMLAILLAACAGTPETQSPAPLAPATEPPAATQPAEAPGSEGLLPEVDPAAVSGEIISAGSSTVYPLVEAMAERFEDEGFAGQVTIDSIGSGAGLERFCVNGETDIANASRAIRDSEIESCRAIGREPVEFRVGTDALAIAVSRENTFLENVTLETLAAIFSGDVIQWSGVNPAWPNEDIKRFSPGTDSGTYDFFVEAVMEPVYGEEAEKAILDAPGIQLSEDDNVLVQGVEGSPYAIGYFGYAYYQENEDLLKTVAVDGIAPSFESAESGDYPLARPLFIYSDATIMQEKPQVAAFINFFLTYVDEEIERVGYFPASPEALETAKQNWLDAME